MPHPTLAALFHAHAPAGVRHDEAGLEIALRRLFEAGRQAWPAIELSPEAFVRQLVTRAVEAFDHTHMHRVGAFVSRLRPSAAFVDDVRQVLREKLFVGKGGAAPKIREYNGRAALASWLRVIAVRAAIDLRRASDDASGDDEAEGRPGGAGTDPEIRFIQQRYRGVFNDAIRDAIDTLEVEHREILRLHFVEGRTLDQLAASLGVHRATVARRVKAAREAVLGRARRRLAEQLGAQHAELESLAGVMMSQIDLSLGGLLAPRGA
jgi:RNA polymerase sigma-70 factor, ECF subfamily